MCVEGYRQHTASAAAVLYGWFLPLTFCVALSAQNELLVGKLYWLSCSVFTPNSGWFQF